jgi:hypothetical protein
MRKKTGLKNVKHWSIMSEMSPNSSAEPEKIINPWIAYTSNHIHEEVFGKKAMDVPKYPWKKKILKITSKATGLSVYRIWSGVPAYVKSKDTLYIDNSAKFALIKSKDDATVELILSKGSHFSFYWNHFENATRISFKLGLTSVGLGIISLILGVFAIT